MHFFIDEGGTFTASAGWSVVCSLALPHKEVGPARREIDFVSRQWPRRDGELKGGALSPAHLEALVDVLYRHHAILHVYPYKRSHLVALRPTKISADDPPSIWWPGER
jgi:hypothetical protein